MVKTKSKELGFGSNTWENSQRFLNKDGTSNVQRFGNGGFSISDLFHRLTTMKWSKFMLLIFVGYFIANVVFATGYYFIGIDGLGIEASGEFGHDWLEAFFFSTQCFTTVGFGRVNPSSTSANVLASIESFAGLMAAALGTGLLYGRFSRPRAEIVFSKNILFAPYKPTENAFMFRFASRRQFSTLVENQVSVSVGINVEEDGSMRRKFYALNLELDKINFLTLSWTIVHPIDADSPLFGKTQEDLLQGRAEFIILFKAYEETTSQAVYQKFSYFADEIVWNARFVPVIGPDAQGRATLNMPDLSKYVKL